MTTTEAGKTSATDELRKKYEATKPSKSELEKAKYKIAKYRPTYPDATGWPAMRKLKLLFILGIGYLAFWVWHTLRVRDGILQSNPIVDLFGFLIVIGLSALALGMVWKLNEGCFSDFRVILEPFLVYHKGELHRSMLRVRSIKQIFPLDPEVEITAEDLAGDLAVPKPPEGSVDDPSGKIAPLALPKIPKKADPEKKDPKKSTIDGNLRPSSITEMIEIFGEILQEEPKQFKGNVEMAVELERRFVELVEALEFEGYFVSMAVTPDYPALIITDFPVESPSGSAKGLQFGFHNFFQKTYIWDKENSSSSSWAVSVHIEDFRFQLFNEAKKKWEMRFAPIFYVAFSDGNLDTLLSQLWPSKKGKIQSRDISAAKQIAHTARNAYTATLAEELIVRDKMHTGIIDSKDKEINQLQRHNTKGAKKIVAAGMRWMVLAGESMDDSNLDRLKSIFSKGAVKWLVYLALATMAFVGFLLVLQILTGMQFFNLPDPGGVDPGNGDAEPYNPLSIVIAFVRTVFL